MSVGFWLYLAQNCLNDGFFQCFYDKVDKNCYNFRTPPALLPQCEVRLHPSACSPEQAFFVGYTALVKYSFFLKTGGRRRISILTYTLQDRQAIFFRVNDGRYIRMPSAKTHLSQFLPELAVSFRCHKRSLSSSFALAEHKI